MDLSPVSSLVKKKTPSKGVAKTLGMLFSFGQTVRETAYEGILPYLSTDSKTFAFKNARIKGMKVKSPTWYRKKCVDRAKKDAKERDNYICQKCGKTVSGMNAHGSHIYNEGTYRSMSADVDNILTFCYYCHIYWWHKNPIEASEWFKKKFPELYKVLRKRSQTIKTVNWKQRYEQMPRL